MELKFSRCEGALIKYLIERFNVYRCALELEKEEMFIEDDGAESTLGFPRLPNPVIESKGSNEMEEYKDVLLVDITNPTLGIMNVVQEFNVEVGEEVDAPIHATDESGDRALAAQYNSEPIARVEGLEAAPKQIEEDLIEEGRRKILKWID